jgi:hypothetical protein
MDNESVQTRFAPKAGHPDILVVTVSLAFEDLSVLRRQLLAIRTTGWVTGNKVTQVMASLKIINSWNHCFHKGARSCFLNAVRDRKEQSRDSPL